MSIHTLRGFGLVADCRARVLILGSFPGQASLQAGHYYAHPRNQFWPIMASILGEDLELPDFEARYLRLLHHRIALWDVFHACRRTGSLDSAIRDPQSNNFELLKARTPALRWVLFNGKTAARSLGDFESMGYVCHVLPSTSPANASTSYESKLAAWRQALKETI